MRTGLLAAVMALVPVTIGAHVTVWPQVSTAAAGERYTVRVPTEGQVATTSVELEVPDGVTVSGVLVGAGYTYESRRQGDRIATITWRQDIKPAEYGEYVFFARNPTAMQIVWKVRQHFADGSSADWVGVEGDRRPASVTKLRPATSGR